MRDGAGHLFTAPYDEQHADTCPITAVENWIAMRKFVGWDIHGERLPFPDHLYDRRGPQTGAGLATTLSEPNDGASEAERRSSWRIQGGFSMHSFRSGGGRFREHLIISR